MLHPSLPLCIRRAQHKRARLPRRALPIYIHDILYRVAGYVVEHGGLCERVLVVRNADIKVGDEYGLRGLVME
jgi:hypothetical protein